MPDTCSAGVQCTDRQEFSKKIASNKKSRTDYFILALTENNASAVQIVWRKSNFYAVARYDSDVMFSHLSRKMRHDYVSAIF